MENKLERMLLWFEDQLPDHELGVPTIVLKEPHYLSAPENLMVIMGCGSVEASALCVNCHTSFQYVNGGIHIKRTLTSPGHQINQWTHSLKREAQKTKCWGKIPHVPEQNYAVID